MLRLSLGQKTIDMAPKKKNEEERRRTALTVRNKGKSNSVVVFFLIVCFFRYIYFSRIWIAAVPAEVSTVLKTLPKVGMFKNGHLLYTCGW